VPFKRYYAVLSSTYYIGIKFIQDDAGVSSIRQVKKKEVAGRTAFQEASRITVSHNTKLRSFNHCCNKGER